MKYGNAKAKFYKTIDVVSKFAFFVMQFVCNLKRLGKENIFKVHIIWGVS